MPNDKTLAGEAADKIGHECFPGNAVYSRGKAQGIIRQAITSANSDLRKENEELKRKMHSMQYESVCYGFRANCVSELCGGCLGCQIMQVQHSLELSDKEHKALHQKLSSAESEIAEMREKLESAIHMVESVHQTWRIDQMENGEPETVQLNDVVQWVYEMQKFLQDSSASHDFVRVEDISVAIQLLEKAVKRNSGESEIAYIIRFSQQASEALRILTLPQEKPTSEAKVNL